MNHVVPIVIAGVVLLAPPRAAATQGPPTGVRATTDQTVSVPRDGRVELSDCSGSLVVRTWDRDAVRVQATHPRRADVRVSSRDQVVVIGSRFPDGAVDYTLTVPPGIALHVEGLACDADVEGLTGDVQLGTIEGNLLFRQLSGHVIASTVEGEIAVEGGRARLQISTVEGPVRLSGAGGEVNASSVDGDIVITASTATALEVSTVDGDIGFSGTLQSGGRYMLTTHDGDIALTLPEGASATIGTRTFEGELESTVPLTLTSDGGRGRRRRVFTIGGGSAQVELETFDGDILIRQ